jgi:hypothetical protein
MRLSQVRTVIGEILVEDGVITREQLNMALKFQESARESGQTLVDSDVISAPMLELMLEVQLVEVIVDLGYADENEIYGPSRSSLMLGKPRNIQYLRYE